MKKILVILLVLLLSVSIVACGSNDKAPDSGADVVVPEKIVLRVGMTVDEESHYGVGATHFKEKVAEYTDGVVDVQIFPNSQLGGERDLLEGVALGTIEMAVTSTGPVSNFSTDFLVFDLPFIITEREKAFKVMDGPIGQEILASLEPSGIKALGFWENGFRQITNDNAPIISPEDVKGMKIRTMENAIHLESFRHLGAQPTPMAWGEVFLALQQGAIDGQENPLIVLENQKVYEVQKYASLTGHFYSPAIMVINKSLLEGFPKDIQDAILKAEKEARDFERQFCIDQDLKLAESLAAAGMIITEVDKDEWQKATMGVYDSFPDINPEHIKALTGQ